MNQQEFIERLSQRTGQSVKECKEFYNSFKDTIKDIASTGEPITLMSFIKFDTRVTKETTGINPSTKEKIRIPSKKKVTVKLLGDWKTLEVYD